MAIKKDAVGAEGSAMSHLEAGFFLLAFSQFMLVIFCSGLRVSQEIRGKREKAASRKLGNAWACVSGDGLPG